MVPQILYKAVILNCSVYLSESFGEPEKTDHGGPATEFLIQQAGEDPAICLFNYLPGDADAGGETFSF